MTIDLHGARRLIDDYRSQYPEDAGLVEELVTGLRTYGSDFFSRANEHGHITCGVVLMDDERRVLLIRHNALARWLTPGGHLEPRDVSLQLAARRELAEETGITDGVAAVTDLPVHIDRHTIPPNEEKHEGEHDHWDLRFLFTCPSTDVSLQLDEVSGFEWRDISLLPPALAARVASLARP